MTSCTGSTAGVPQGSVLGPLYNSETWPVLFLKLGAVCSRETSVCRLWTLFLWFWVVRLLPCAQVAIFASSTVLVSALHSDGIMTCDVSAPVRRTCRVSMRGAVTVQTTWRWTIAEPCVMLAPRRPRAGQMSLSTITGAVQMTAKRSIIQL